MRFDETRRENLSADTRIFISQLLQYGLLDVMFRKCQMNDGELVFQGGTAIHVGYGSPRRSEDLDFMLAADKAPSLARLVAESVAELQPVIQKMLPGSTLSTKAKPPKDITFRVDRHDITWSHTKKMGTVTVQMEFMLAPTPALAAYGSERRSPSSAIGPMVVRARMAENTFTMSEDASLVLATPRAIIGDKMVAIAMRSYVKPRDYFDLWWLHEELKLDLSDAELADQVGRSAAIYGYTDVDLLAGIERLKLRRHEVDGGLQTELEKYLPESIADEMLAAGNYDAMVALAFRELDRLTILLETGPDAPGAGGFRP